MALWECLEAVTLSAMSEASTLRQRRLGRELRRLREQAGMTCEQAGEMLEFSASMISRIEGGSRRVRTPDLIALLDAYGLTDPVKREAVLRLAREAKQKDWFSDYADVLSAPYRDYLALESCAALIRTYQPQCVPGLLQTEPYARALLSAEYDDPDKVEKIVKVRLERQRILRRENPVELWAIVDAPVLRRTIGGVRVLRDQLHHLAAVAELPNVTVQVLPYDTEATVIVPCGSFVTLSFPEPGGCEGVFLENLAGNTYLESDEAVRAYAVAFDRIRDVALDPDASLEMIKKVAEELDDLVGAGRAERR